MKNDGVSLSRPPRTIWIATLLCGLAAALFFTLWPEVDLYTSSLFYEGNGRFFLVGNPLGTIPRLLFKIFFISFCGLTLAGFVFTLFKRTPLFGFALPHWAYLVACLVIGPGILTNTILKDNWGRARPVQTEQFGSSEKFTPALIPSKACKRNCSFVSGESSSIYMIFFSLALLLSSYRKLLLISGIVIGSMAGLIRMGMGGHFLSDVTFSGIFMLLTAGALYWLIITKATKQHHDHK
jgi:lipid A 4'-phosphatase